MIEIKAFCVNPLQENCYIVSDETGECAIIDCGAWYDEEHKAVDNYITSHQLTPTHLLCTHGHFDHIIGNGHLFDTFGIIPEIHNADAFLVNDINGQLRSMMGISASVSQPPTVRWLADGDIISTGVHLLKVMHTPGHTPGGVCFYCEQENVLFSGDTLFRMSMGRTDFEGGSWQQLLTSLQTVLAPLPPETKVYTGHGPMTTIKEEKLMNPYLKQTNHSTI